MDYLFFDIECSEGKSICSFGYVLTDEFFCIKEKKDILINPQSYFHTGPWSKKAKDEGISLAYPVSEFKAQPPFPALYDQIKVLLNRKDIQIVTFSGDNDARFLNYACTRYHMPRFNYSFIDVQKIYQDIEGLKDQLSLEKMLTLFEVDIEGLVQHKSDDDAHITMLVTEALCRKTGKPLSQLVKESQRAVCLSKTYMPKKKKQKSSGKEDAKVKEGETTQNQPTSKKPSTKKAPQKKDVAKKSGTPQAGKTKKTYKPRTKRTNTTKKDN